MIIIGFILFFFVIAAVLYDILFNKLHGKHAIIFIVLPSIFGLLFIFGARETIFALVIMITAVGMWIWLESLYERLNDVAVDRTKTITGRLSILAITLASTLLLRYLVYPVMSSFLEHLEKLISIPKLVSVIATFIVVYCLIIFAFGVAYTAIHLALEGYGFRSGTPLKLKDFFLYSAFNIVTQGYKDMAPDHWVLSCLSIFQIFVGIILLSIYLAGAFSFVIQSPINK